MSNCDFRISLSFFFVEQHSHAMLKQAKLIFAFIKIYISLIFLI